MFRQQGISKQVVTLASFGNRRQKSVTIHWKWPYFSTRYAGTTNERQQQNQRTRLRHASVALQPAMLAVTSVMTLFFMLIVTCLMSHIKFFKPDSVSGSACSPVIKPLGQSVNAENIKMSSSGMLTLKRIGIVYGMDV
ncbi:MAG: hypothetical protein EZS28_037277 [Streblomastix strix]|uniref:Uncharacterized protein n=1 Tax=Streblomastix strix TaxID=222440 RepID=A0A5J4U9D9_9EUKA|nr:MAG: hypothetical protein EZS28_037277 [Streblomastix strix]